MIKEVIKDALKAGKESYEARKRGKQPCIKTTYKIPVLDFGYWPWTIEATLFLTEDADLRAAVKERFFLYLMMNNTNLHFPLKAVGVNGF